MSLVLPVDVYSPDQLNELILALHQAAGDVRDHAVRQSDEPPALSADLEALLQQNNLQAGSAEVLEGLAAELSTTLERAPTVHILVAATPSRAMKRQFTTWFRTQIHPLTLINYAARGDLGGGAIIQAGSHLYDFSFRRSILDHKARLTEIAGV